MQPEAGKYLEDIRKAARTVAEKEAAGAKREEFLTDQFSAVGEPVNADRRPELS